ncbi:MAG: hypothetical protein U0414_24615 [Polyangiaceae bacterium]
MDPRARYGLIVAQSGATHIGVSINDIPLHDVGLPRETFKGATTPPDHWLMPGANVLTMRVKDGVVGPSTAVNATVWDGETDERLAEIHWPHDYAVDDPTRFQHGSAPREVVARPFAIPDTHRRPIYMDAPRRDVPLRGDAEAWAPIEAFHDAFERGDRDGVFEGLSLKASEWFRYYQASMSTPEAVRKMVEDMVPGPYEMLPLDRGATVFEPIAGGRMLRVLRADGLPLITGRCADPSIKPCLLPRPFLVFHEGRYRILY